MRIIPFLRPFAAVALTAATFALPLLPARADEPVTLKLKWVQGEVLRYRMTSDTTTATTGAHEMETTQKQVMTMHMTTKQVAADGAATVEMVIDSTVVDMTLPTGDMHYDSTKPSKDDDSPMTKPMAAMIGEPLTITFEESGKVRAVVGFDRIIDKMLAAMGGEGGAAGKMMRQSFNDGMIKQMFDPAFHLFPDRPVKTGDSWPVELSMKLPMVGALKSVNTYTLTSVQGEKGNRTASLASAATMSVTPPKPGEDADGLPESMKLEFKEGTSTGTTQFDIGRGRVVKSDTATAMKMVMTMSMGGGAPMVMNQDTTSKVRMELLPAEDAAAAPAGKAKSDK